MMMEDSEAESVDKVNFKSKDLMLKNSTKELVKQNNKYFEEKKDCEVLSDGEGIVQQFILTPEESHIKTVLWNHIHKEWLEEQTLKKGIFYFIFSKIILL